MAGMTRMIPGNPTKQMQAAQPKYNERYEKDRCSLEEGASAFTAFCHACRATDSAITPTSAIDYAEYEMFACLPKARDRVDLYTSNRTVARLGATGAPADEGFDFVWVRQSHLGDIWQNVIYGPQWTVYDAT